MRYRVVRDIGDSDYPVGTTFDGAALSERRRMVLVEQRRIEPLPEPEPKSDPEPEPRRERRKG